MVQKFLVLIALLFGFQASALEGLLLNADNSPEELGWTVGDNTNYNLDAGIAKGTLSILVREETSEGFWLNQDADLGGFGKQKVEVLIEKTTGKVLELIVNGEKKDVPNDPPPEVVEVKDASVTVPAGTFDATYVKTKDKDGKFGEAWANRDLVPVSGMIKSIQPSQFGNVTLELTNFKKK